MFGFDCLALLQYKAEFFLRTYVAKLGVGFFCCSEFNRIKKCVPEGIKIFDFFADENILRFFVTPEEVNNCASKADRRLSLDLNIILVACK